MATSKEYINYVLECLGHIEGIDARRMFGEYGLYMFNRVMGFVCDDQVFLKILPGSTRVLGEDAPTGEAYPGSKPYYMIEGADVVEITGEEEDVPVHGQRLHLGQLFGDGMRAPGVVHQIGAAQGDQLLLHTVCVEHRDPPFPASNACPAANSGHRGGLRSFSLCCRGSLFPGQCVMRYSSFRTGETVTPGKRSGFTVHYTEI